jgi:hypothetical protein
MNAPQQLLTVRQKAIRIIISTMAEPGFSLRRFEEVDGQGTVGSSEQEPLMKSGASCVALGFGLLTETLFAMGQTISPPFVVAQGPSSAPASTARPRRGATIGRSDAPADGRAPCHHHCAC